MGDMADMALDAVLDFEERISLFRSGYISQADAYDQGIINERGVEHGQGVNLKTCRCCGTTGLHWEMSGDKWRLFDAHGMHICPVNPIVDRSDTENSYPCGRSTSNKEDDDGQY